MTAQTDRLETALQALLESLQGQTASETVAYADVAIDAAEHRADPTGDSAFALARSAETLLREVDDASTSRSPERDEATAALDAYLRS